MYKNKDGGIIVKRLNHYQNKEGKKFTDYWLTKNVQCLNFGSMNHINSFDNKHGKLITIAEFEKPDVLLIFGKTIFALEHFSFDSYQTNKKGSPVQEQKSLFFNNKNEKGFFVEEIRNQANIKFYIENLIRTAENHISKLSSYKNNLSRHKGVVLDEKHYISFEDKNIEWGFITEDTSVDYNMHVSKKTKSKEYTTPFHIKEFRELISNYPTFKHFFHLVKDNNEEKILYYFYNTPGNLSDLESIMNYSSPKKILEAKAFIWKNVVE